MDSRELILLSPYRLPAQNTLVLSNHDVAAFLNGYVVLWHPGAIAGAARPPIVASPYDYEQPKPGQIFAVPDSPPLVLPDDWDQRVLDAGATAFRSTPDRETTLANLKEALRASASAALLDLPAESVGPFFGIGFGFLQIEGLFEAMEHENLLATSELWQDVQAAVAALPGWHALSTAEGVDEHQAEARPSETQGVPPIDTFQPHLKAAAERLLAAREVLYPVAIHLIDLALLEEQKPVPPHPGPPPQGGRGAEIPESFDSGFPVNLIASSSVLEKFARDQPEKVNLLRERFQSEQLEFCGGCYVEREEPLLPVESQLWNLAKGQAVARELLGKEITIFARKRFGFHPQTPLLLNSVGIHRVVALVFDDAALPNFRTTITSWPSPDGKQVDAFTRKPFRADDPQTFFHLAHHLCQTIRQDHAATLALLHAGTPAVPWYKDWLELSRFGPVLGQWTTLSRYFNEVLAGEQASASSVDEFHADYLSERTTAGMDNPVSGFARQVRERRGMDTAWTLAAIHHILAGGSRRDREGEAPAEPLALQGSSADSRKDAKNAKKNDSFASFAPLREISLEELEDKLETGQDVALELLQIQKGTAENLAEKLLARAAADQPGYLVLNPCSFTRRVALELSAGNGPIPVDGPVKASQIHGDKNLLVVEVPGLGFAWFPQAGPAGAGQAAGRMRLADSRHVRNEFFEAEIDPATGGLRGLWDHRTRVSRLGQQLVFNPGSSMRASKVTVTSTGPALGEVVTEGAILGDQEQVLASFRQRFRAWLGRPILELRVEIFPQQPPAGYPWHAYYGARFAWREERTMLLRGVNGVGYITSHTRPESPDYLEFRLGRQSTVLFPGGLPFHQRHGSRMLDVILVPEGEKGQAFDLALGLDREYPMHTALGMVTPVPLVPVSKGPPHVGASGWLFHLDASNLLLFGLRPAPDNEDGIRVRMMECNLHGGSAELRCVRNPTRAALLDARGETLLEAGVHDDAVSFEVSPGDLIQLRVDCN
jgi:hypothetical protein